MSTCREKLGDKPSKMQRIIIKINLGKKQAMFTNMETDGSSTMAKPFKAVGSSVHRENWSDYEKPAEVETFEKQLLSLCSPKTKEACGLHLTNPSLIHSTPASVSRWPMMDRSCFMIDSSPKSHVDHQSIRLRSCSRAHQTAAMSQSFQVECSAPKSK